MTVKNWIKYLLQRGLGFRNYLYVFALFKIRTLKTDAKEKDFFHFLSLLEDGKGAVLDIGANLGIMTVHLAKKVPNSTIHAFEPIPDNLSVLRKITKQYGTGVRIYETAIGDHQGEVKMILPRIGKTRMQGLSHVKHESITERTVGDEYAVQLNTLDNLLNGEPIQGIKIDIENFEYFALKGGKRILKKNKPLIYAELWDNNNRTQCMNLLLGLDYHPFVIDNGILTPFLKENHQQQNFIFVVK
jgi:FkbM family methyltransferase